jgi:hypothetical protein
MMKTIIPYYCPDCGAELNDLQNIIQLSSLKNPKMSFRCMICESTFDVVGDHCMQIYRETRRAEKFAASRNQNKISVGVTA